MAMKENNGVGRLPFLSSADRGEWSLGVTVEVRTPQGVVTGF